MIVLVVCAVLLLAGLAVTAAWGHRELRPPPSASPPERPAVTDIARRSLWELAVASVAGVVTGVLVLGPGGRLAMRLLAMTSPDSTGSLTEAGEVIGDIDTGGTIALLVFGGLLPGLACGGLYAVLRRWLPAGRAGGVLYGLLLLVLFSTRVDPLRPDNVDFVLLGPGWLSVLVFGGGTVLAGMSVAAVAARVSAALPLPSWRPRTLAAYAAALLLPAVVFPLGAAAVALALLTVVASRVPGAAALWRSPGVLVAGRLVLGVVALAALPGFVTAITDILTAG